MSYNNAFEKLEVWILAHALVLKIYKLVRLFPPEEKFALVDQLKRSTSSVAANIVEGHERKGAKEFSYFLYNAKASLAETKYHLLLARDLKYFGSNLYEELISDANYMGKMLNGLINYLKTKRSSI